MGRLNNDPSINHFSHPHPLQLSNLQSLSSPYTISLCSACELQASGWIYSCKPCNFTLHMSCTQLPPLITHPSHPMHPLTLLSSPVYSGGAFNCDGCGRNGHGFSYHCSQCLFDVHTTCAQNPLSLSHQSHPHILNLIFHPPYLAKAFSCDICQKVGSNHWLYRCGACEFDAHLDCAMSLLPPQPSLAKSHTQLQHHNSFPGAMVHQQNVSMGGQGFFQSPSMGAMQNGYQQPVGQQNSNPIMDATVQGFVYGAAHQIGRNLLQNLMGGGNSDNNNDPDNGGGGGGGNSSSSILSLGSSILSGVFSDSSS